MRHILVVDDDPITAKMIDFLLRDQGFTVSLTPSPSRALEIIDEYDIDLIIHDVRLPEMSGFDLAREIRSRQSTPIIILSALKSTEDVVAGLQAGADDYLVKPFDPSELLARVWAMLRRVEQVANSVSNLRNSDLVLDPGKNEVTLLGSGQVVLLTPLESRLLQVLIGRPGQTMSRESLLIKVWGYDYDTMSNQLDVYISRLRAKIEEDRLKPLLIETVRSIGYRFVPSCSVAAKKRRAKETLTLPALQLYRAVLPID